MSETVLVALITFIGSIAVAYITARTEVSNKITELMVKVDLLWAVYVEDAVKDAREAGLARKNSPEELTERWEEIVDEPLRTEINRDIVYYLKQLDSAYDASIETYRKHQPALLEIADEHDIRNQAIIGALYVMAKIVMGRIPK